MLAFRFTCLIYCALLIGCTSVSSTLLNRSDDNSFYGNSNGNTQLHNIIRPFDGVPITVRVPTHVDIFVKEKLRFYIDKQENSITKLAGCKRHIGIDKELIYTNKIFTVDPKRPPAGTLDYTMEFGAKGDLDNRQYFKSIQSKIVDETIQDVTAAIATITEALPTSKALERTADVPEGMIEEFRTVAWKRFDVDAPDFEEQIAVFVGHHLNNCHSCQGCQRCQASAVPIGNVGIVDGVKTDPLNTLEIDSDF